MVLEKTWRRLLRVPWISRRPNQSLLKEIGPEYSLEGLMQKLKFQYCGHLMERANSLEKTLILVDPDWGQEEKRVTENEIVGWHHGLSRHEFEQILRDSEGRGSLACCSPWGHKESDMIEQLNNNSNKLSILLTKIQMFLKSWINNFKIPYSKKLIMG